MKPTSTPNQVKELESRPEQISTEGKLQTYCFASPYRLQRGDTILYGGKACPVIRVNDCAAVIEVARSERNFTTLFGKSVRIQPKPQLVRISANSLCQILSRGNGGVA
jgi:hypothetical protein